MTPPRLPLIPPGQLPRRDFLTATLVATLGARLSSAGAGAADLDRAGPALGLGAYSCAQAWAALRGGQPNLKFKDTLSFLEYAHSLGAAGVQTALRPADNATARLVRHRAEQLTMYYEGELRLPADEADLARFEADMELLQTAGARVARAAALSGRRYETFKSAAEFAEFRRRTERSLILAEPVLKKHAIRLALENHKDWLVPELLALLRSLSSPWVGVTVDTGNNLALLEDPLEVVAALAPLAMSVHLKDMAVQETEDGFLLSEVPLGAGFLDLPAIVGTLRRANPAIAFNLEMITRDPLRIPCLTAGYWPTLVEMKASQLAAALARVRSLRPRRPLPQIRDLPVPEQLALEEQNNRLSLDFAHDRLGL